MDFIYGALVVEGVSWTHEDNLALMVANTVMSYTLSLIVPFSAVG